MPSRKIYHIVHRDKLASIVADGLLFSDEVIAQRPVNGTTIGMDNIKARRMNELQLASHPGLFVGQCVPFYFCPRSVMLYLISARNWQLSYKGGQEPIVHLVADLCTVAEWADANKQRWAFTLSNAGACDFEDRADLGQLSEINWAAVCARQWSGGNIDPSIKYGKQAEFLVEEQVPWNLIEKIAVYNQEEKKKTEQAIRNAPHKPDIQIERKWYY